jgi:hypothetical protein
VAQNNKGGNRERLFSMGELGVNTIVGISSFVIGSVFGAVVQRADFWTMGGISDPMLMGDGSRFRSWLLAIAVAISGSQALFFGKENGRARRR